VTPVDDRVPPFLCCREPVCGPRPSAIVGPRIAVEGAINQIVICVKCKRIGESSERC